MIKIRKRSMFRFFYTKGQAIETPNFSIKNISKSFLQAGITVKILDNASYEFKGNKSYAIMAPSGVGKSTLLHMLSGIDHPCSGSIALGDKKSFDLCFHKKTALLKKSIGIVLQQSYLISELTVIENVMLKGIISHGHTNEDKKHAIELLKEIGLENKAHAFPESLSGGQQQKIAILRSIFQVPEFLLADEPTGNLDESSGNQIIQLLLHYQKKYAMGLIISTHDIKIANQCDIIVRIENQKLM
jgi:ABC-type lipoprotein export system ATPase subunit